MYARPCPPAGRRPARVLSLLLALLAGAGCAFEADRFLLGPSTPSVSALDAASPATSRQSEMPPFDPANFVPGVDHPYFPLQPGTSWTFREADGEETVVIEVLPATQKILGIPATVVRDRVYVGEELVEDTLDWFAQDRDGNVWYLGEEVKNYVDGKLVDTAGSWEAGVDGARAGIQMLAEPEPGDAYFQEDAPGVAEDQARVRRVDVPVSVPFGDFADCLQIVEWTPLEPGNRGYKFYARGVGLVLESDTGDKGRVELVTRTSP